MLLPRATGGGAERVSILLANELTSRGVTVAIVFARRYGPLLETIDPAVATYEMGGRRNRFNVLRLPRLLRRLQPKTVISAMVELNVAAVIAAWLARSSARIILTEHNQTDRNYEVLRSGVSRIAYRLIGLTYPRADKVICVSKGVLDALVRFSGVSPTNLTVVHNPIVTPALLQQSQAACDHPWLASKDQPVLLSVGRLVKAKDLETLLHAFAKLRQRRPCRLILLGEGTLRPRLEGLADELKIREYVDMPGFNGNPYSFMARADLFVLSSAWEGFPTVLVEALACGIPIVSTDCPSGPREILSDGRFGTLVPVGDVDALAAAIETALSSPPPEGGQARGMQFTAARAVDRYQDLINALDNGTD
ncbi:MAG: glycosyltransferase [Alphaproteobacteria bacterium]